MPYKCKHECGFRPGSPQCLAYQLKKLAEEVAELQEALTQYYIASEMFDEKCLDWLDRVRAEWKDVCTMVEGIRKYHGDFLESDVEVNSNEQANSSG